MTTTRDWELLVKAQQAEIAELRKRLELATDVCNKTAVLVGPKNIGKTVDTNIYWDGAISAIMNGKALSDVVVALSFWEKGPQ